MLDRDIINRVPELKQKIDSIHDVVRKISNEVCKIYKSDLELRIYFLKESIKKESCYGEAGEKLDMYALRRFLMVPNVDYQVQSIETNLVIEKETKVVEEDDTKTKVN